MAQHAALHDPARALREIGTKRRTLARHAPPPGRTTIYATSPPPGTAHPDEQSALQGCRRETRLSLEII
ncbi:DUF6221 family protein [Streptomyces sp. NPDC060198]|uniref:DUF6221 family protein n=1 Tax=Streptomyces sp. NPDC060198 TaxID=3347070 RepID=UPI0036548A7E